MTIEHDGGTATPVPRPMRIEFTYLDVTTSTRRRATDRDVAAALALPEDPAPDVAARPSGADACCAAPGPPEPCCDPGAASDRECCGVGEGEVCGCR